MCLSLVQDVLVQFLTTDEIKLNVIDAEDPEVSGSTIVSDELTCAGFLLMSELFVRICYIHIYERE